MAYSRPENEHKYTIPLHSTTLWRAKKVPGTAADTQNATANRTKPSLLMKFPFCTI